MDRQDERIETLIVGGGQAGLATGYYLAKRGRPFAILDANERVGDPWRKRWDSLRLFTPARYAGLPGWGFPARAWSYPSKDDMADYLEAYAARFDLPVRTGVRVDALTKEGERFVLVAGERRFEADNVVVASGAHRTPRIPAFARELAPDIVQLHSSAYRNPAQLREGGVLLVGAGNSGADIALEVARGHPTWLSGRDTGHIPVRIDGAGRFVFPVVRFVGHHVLTMGTPVGRRVGPKLVSKGDPLVRVKPKDLAAAGVERIPKVTGVRGGQPMLEDDRVLEVANVVWCTGFRQDLSWIDLRVFGEDGTPLHDRGVVDAEPGLYFVGLLFQYSLSSCVLPGIGRDHQHVAKHIAARGRGAQVRPVASTTVS